MAYSAVNADHAAKNGSELLETKSDIVYVTHASRKRLQNVDKQQRCRRLFEKIFNCVATHCKHVEPRCVVSNGDHCRQAAGMRMTVCEFFLNVSLPVASMLNRNG